MCHGQSHPGSGQSSEFSEHFGSSEGRSHLLEGGSCDYKEQGLSSPVRGQSLSGLTRVSRRQWPRRNEGAGHMLLLEAGGLGSGILSGLCRGLRAVAYVVPPHICFSYPSVILPRIFLLCLMSFLYLRALLTHGFCISSFLQLEVTLMVQIPHLWVSLCLSLSSCFC